MNSIIASFLFASAWMGGSNGVPLHQVAVDCKDPEAERLIDQLPNAGRDSDKFSPDLGSSFLEDVRVNPGLDRTAARNGADPAIKRLVQMGLKALPSLIAHLSDERPTKLRFQMWDQGLGGLSFSSLYDSRYHDKAVQARVGGGKDVLFGDSISDGKYTFRVGDLCVTAIGVIVNRPLSALRGFPTNCFFITSPVQNPRLAEAVERDWAGITPAEHAKQLELDVQGDWPLEALQRLMVYYPEEGGRFAKRLLQCEPRRTSLISSIIECVKSLSSVSGEGLDSATQDLFETVAQCPTPTPHFIYEDDLGMACAERMAEKGFRAEYLAYFKKRLYEVRGTADSSRLFELETWVKRLQTNSGNGG